MLQFLINVLTPVFENMGVSPTDVEQYVNSLGGYIYAILALFVVMVAVSAAVAWVLIVVVLANVICYGPMYNNIAPILNGKASISEESKAALL